MSDPPTIQTLAPERLDEAVDVLCGAFFDYPVMRFLAGGGSAYRRRLRLLIEFLTTARFLRDDLVLGVETGDGLLAVANINRPGESPAPAALDEHRERLLRELGEGARARYEAFGAATSPFVRPDPHYHLGMIGVRREHTGKGLGRLLLDQLHELSSSDPRSTGVSLTTEVPENVPLYEHFGYRVVGRAPVGDFQSWSMFRPDPQRA